MDVTFTNVLEGARQYFQGVPAAGGGAQNAYPEQNGQPAQPERPPPAAAPSAAAAAPYWQPELPSQQQQRPQHPQPPQGQYPQQQQQPQQQQPPYEFQRPQSREQHQQYQPHIATNVPNAYQQQPQQQQARRPQEAAQYQQQQQQYAQHAQHAQQQRYYRQPYQPPAPQPQQQQPVVQQQQQQQNAYYKHIYTSQSSTVPYSSSGGSSTKTTHNLPPIAALSYHSRSSSNSLNTSTSTNSSAGASASVSAGVSRSAIRPPSSSVISQQSYSAYNQTYQQHQPQYSTATTQSYSSVIVTSAQAQTTFAQPYQTTSAQYQQPQQPKPPRNNVLANHQQNFDNRTATNHLNGRLPGVLKPKRESPLDLSVKTVRTSADSTLDDAENDARLHRLGYPVHDVQRNFLHRQQMQQQQQQQQQQQTTAPKVEFRPNFDIRSYVPSAQAHTAPQARYPSTRYPTVPIPSTHMYQSGIPRIDLTGSVKKRQGDPVPGTVPRKVPRADDNTWRQSIDQQIDQKLSNYKQEQQLKYSAVPNPPNNKVNGAVRLQDNTKKYHQYQYAAQSMPHQYYQPQQYAYPARTQAPYLPQAAQSTKAPSGADRRVIDMLRISLEQKQSKLDGAHLRHDIQHPSTDVSAPLQPKPGLVSRNNVSPFTPTSFQETMTIYKFPKAVDSVTNLDVTKDAGAEFDGLAALVAARIRTKGELKQGNMAKIGLNQSQQQQPQLQVVPTQHLQQPQLDAAQKSPVKLDLSCSSTNSSVSPPKLKDRASLIPPRRRLFSRNEDEMGNNNNNVPLRDKSGLRSSSETSVFDFPDSDSDETERQTLHAMRRDRKTSTKQPGDVKVESPRAPSPTEDIFGQMCDNFLQQLKTGEFKKKGRRRKQDISEPIDEPPPAPSVAIKEEPSAVVPEAVVVKTEQPEATIETKVEPEVQPPEPKRASSCDNIPLLLQADDKPDPTDSDAEQKTVMVPLVTRPPKKPCFGDGSDFYPGWEESVYKYKKSLRMPPNLIRVTKPQKFHRLSTSLPDLDPCPISPHSVPSTDGTVIGEQTARKLHKIKSEPADSDADSNCSFNLFSKQSNYDSEGGSSIRSLPNTAKEGVSILDHLLEKYGSGKKRKYNKTAAQKPAQGTAQVDKDAGAVNKPLSELRQKAMDVLIKNHKLLGGNKFDNVVRNTRTRKDARNLKQRATIKEVFGDDRPASAPPVTCVNEIRIKQEQPDNTTTATTTIATIKVEPLDLLDTKLMLKNKLLQKGKKCNNASASVEDDLDDDILKDILIKRDPDTKSGTPSIDDEGSISGKKRSKFRSIRRKFSSGFDYIRKKKKVVKKDVDDVPVKPKRRGASTKANPESEQDIQKEIKTWVLNKGIGETHLHRAARLGYTDITAYCLEKMECQPSPKDNAGYTPLHEACSRGHLDIAKLLLKYGANVSESAQGGIRPLHEAVENGYMEITRLLLSYGADPSLATYSGLTPIALAKDEITMQLLKDHIDDINGVPGPPWCFMGSCSETDGQENGYDILEDAPEGDSVHSEEEDIEFEVSDSLLPNLYTLRGESVSDRWVLLQDLSTFLKVKSRDTLMKQLCPASTSAASQKNLLRELKMSDFLEQARCCQFLNAGEKLNARASKIALVKYTDRVRELLNVESVVINNR